MGKNDKFEVNGWHLPRHHPLQGFTENHTQKWILQDKQETKTTQELAASRHHKSFTQCSELPKQEKSHQPPAKKSQQEQNLCVQDGETVPESPGWKKRLWEQVVSVLRYYLMPRLNKSQCGTLTHHMLWVFTFLSTCACVGTKNSGCCVRVVVFTWYCSYIGCSRNGDHGGGATIAVSQQLSMPAIWQRDAWASLYIYIILTERRRRTLGFAVWLLPTSPWAVQSFC